MNCPQCGATVPTDDVTAELAHCAACDHVWETGLVGMHPLELDPPPGVTVLRNDGREVELLMPWGTASNPRVHGLWAFVLLPVFVEPSLPSFALSMAFLWLWLAATKNSTVTKIGPRGLSVEHGPYPIPVLWSGLMSPATVRSRTVKVRTEPLPPLLGQALVQETTTSLRVGRTPVLQWWSVPEKVEIVESCLQQLLLNTPEPEPQVESPAPEASPTRRSVAERVRAATERNR